MNYVGLILEKEDGKILFQLRDNKLGILNPNKWSLFGGGIEKNEEPRQAATRELYEELGIKSNKNQLKLFITFYGFKKTRYIYKLEDNNFKLKLNEGSSMGYFSPREMLFKKNVVLSLRLFLLIYPFLNLIVKK